MKRTTVKVTLLLVLALAAVWGGYFYFKNFSGIYPAISGPGQDIAVMVRKDESPLVYPDTFALSVFADNLPGPRVIIFDPEGTMLVSLPSAGRVVALPDGDNNGRADRIITVADNLNRPHGLAFSSESQPRLFIAETNRVAAYVYDPEKYEARSPEPVAELPGGGRHFTRSLIFMPPPHENRLLISVGSSCDTCREEDWRRAKILAVDIETGELQTFGSGLRNAVFMTLHPESKEIWVTEMGRDYLGDNLPPDEINIVREGSDYGWPYCYGKNIVDTEFLGPDAEPDTCSSKTPSFIDLQAHSAPLGLDFFPARGWPKEYRHNLLVAYHGSWNRTIPTGYKVVLFRFDQQGKLTGREDFISGWLRDKSRSIGRPVAVRIREDGSIFISDDKAGVIYRLARSSDNVGAY